MAEQCPNKNDIQVVFKRLRSIPTNKACFDCSAKNPTWASVTYGVFICIDCSAVHRSLGVHVTFVRSTQLDTNWTWLQLRQMQLGGNANATTFFRQHNCTTTDAQQKYNSRAAQLYKEKLQQMAIQAMRLHGSKLHLEPHSEVTQTTEQREEDFFEEHSTITTMCPESIDDDLTFGSINKVHTNRLITQGQDEPNVDAALNATSEITHERKPTIGMRKPQSKRTGLGAKKGGLGAQKVKTNFADIEREASLADQIKLQAAEEAKLLAQQSALEEQKQIASVRLAYQDLSIKQQQQEEQLRRVDPLKAQQVERLGMGVNSRIGVSHSALSDMKVIEQESPSKSNNTGKSVFDRDPDNFFDDYHFSSPGYSMFKSSGENKGLESFFLDNNSSRDRYSSSNKGWTSLEPERNQPLLSMSSSEERPSPSHRESSSSTSSASSVPLASSNEAQKKFGSAKAISSDQFFGDSTDYNWEHKANLSRFEGSSSISSADFFGTGGSSNRGSSSSMGSGLHTPDLEEVKESVRQGVTKVAGKLSSIASGVMSSIQDRYAI